MKLNVLRRKLYWHLLVNKVKIKIFNTAVRLGIARSIEDKPVGFCDKCRNGLIPESDLRIYARSNNESIRADAASALNCPGDVLLLLSKDKSSFVQFYVAKNHYTNKYILDYLSKYGNNGTKSTVMTNINCSKTTRNLLILDVYCEGFIAEIPNLEEHYIRKYFCLDPYTTERMCAQQCLPDDIIKKILSGNNKTLISAIKWNPKLK